jgi:hypothetical protein
MKIYIVSKVTDSLTEPATETVSAHVDKDRADAAAKAIAGRVVVQDTLQSVTYGVVETVELDLSGTELETGALGHVVADAERRLADH